MMLKELFVILLKIKIIWIKDKNHMDKEIYTKALKWYAERKDKDMLKLAKYSKKLNIEKEVAEIMQVIL